ncbi:hypothetical protein [Methylopila turkensis]|uniref:Uncharacterized protein n=1 Tax=Methylopila turkensis TaxID=1437816 RepID=A0A9W6JJJ5_9HYPH|nr:hypothetical protein [Methylopila turkensis]GLK78856.1 hypothetical protein GCM10008174_05970 [Methylopila turkensis]
MTAAASAAREVKTFENDAGDQRVVILERADGAYTFCRQWLENGVWGDLGPAVGIYDSVWTAECEARDRTPWLASLFN